MKQIQLPTNVDPNLYSTVWQMMLESRPALARMQATPVCGKTYDLFLLRGEQVVCSLCRTARQHHGQTLQEVLGLDERQGERVLRYLAERSADFCAVALPDHDRVLLLATVPGMEDGEAMAIVPHIGRHSVSRVLCYSFASSVEVDEQVQRAGGSRMREVDEITFLFLGQLLRTWRLLFGSPTTGQEVSVWDRRTLSIHMQSMTRALLAFVGVPSDDLDMPTFPLPCSFRGTLYPSRAAWMLLCLFCGLYRRYRGELLSCVRLEPDNERLLPMIAFSAGNRARLPEEWQECERVAEKYGMFFDIRRRKNTVYVRVCPITIQMTANEFYALRAQLPTLWQLHAEAPFWGREGQRKEKDEK